MAGFFVTIFKNDKQAVERLHREVSGTANKAIDSAHKLSETIKEMIDRKHEIDGKPTNGTTKRA